MKNEINQHLAAYRANDHLKSTCEAVCRKPCDQAVKQGPNGRWFITAGHAGFNSHANNRSGYKTCGTAERITHQYAAKAGR
ncbi:MAG: hypothetical protein KGZ65_04425 [Sphingomonadales bacterium]|nr:hypothetical protein [Sphingomonadaceae bacterium]MBS3930460.1 hypothetical protein [Sphingomonadales bacterium]